MAALPPTIQALGAHGRVHSLRHEVVSEARSWILTPYIKKACVKHAGVDCGMLPYAVCRKFELVPEITDLPELEDGWFCHTSDERYARTVERYFRKLVEAQARREIQPEFLPGNIVMVQSFGSRVLNHAGIITDWPKVIHSAPDSGVAEIDASTDPFWAFKRIAVYDIGA